MTTLVLDDLNPRRLITANRRIHHMVRAEVCAYWRKLAHDAVVRERGPYWTVPVRIVITFRFPDKRRRDVGNLYPYVAKPLVDGLVDAELLADDDDTHVIGPDLRRDASVGPHRITVSIEAAA